MSMSDTFKGSPWQPVGGIDSTEPPIQIRVHDADILKPVDVEKKEYAKRGLMIHSQHVAQHGIPLRSRGCLDPDPGHPTAGNHRLACIGWFLTISKNTSWRAGETKFTRRFLRDRDGEEVINEKDGPADADMNDD